MPLTPAQDNLLYEALASAFPRPEDLQLMMGLKFGVVLDQVIGGESYPQILFNLVIWAKSQGRVSELIRKARRQAPQNPELARAEQQIGPCVDQARRQRVFLCYQVGSQPDDDVALRIRQEFATCHDLFWDQTGLVGRAWSERIVAELQAADFMILLLSAQAVQSGELLEYQVRLASKLCSQQGRPLLLPVRLADRQPFPAPLDGYLNSVNWTYWETRADTPTLLDELWSAVNGGQLSLSGTVKQMVLMSAPAAIVQPAVRFPAPLPSSPLPSATSPLVLEQPGGTMDPQSRFYIPRPGCDDAVLNVINQSGTTITIKGPRQVGKSSLLARLFNSALTAERQTVFLDFSQEFDQASLRDGDRFYRRFCSAIAEKLDTEAAETEAIQAGLAAAWNGLRDNVRACTYFVSQHVLPKLKRPLTLAMDETERVFGASFQSDFFGMLRGWHNARATNSIWKRLDLILVTSTEPDLFIEDRYQSPFNVGTVVDLDDFDRREVSQLNGLHGHCLNSDEEQRLFDLIHGHPYLVRRALYLVASGQKTPDELFAQAADDTGPFAEHLRRYLLRLNGKDRLTEGLLQVIYHRSRPAAEIFYRLRGAGLVREEGKGAVVRCPLYARYFHRYLVDGGA